MEVQVLSSALIVRSPAPLRGAMTTSRDFALWASEFLAIDDADEPALRANFDVWLYDELGYERPNVRS